MAFDMRQLMNDPGMIAAMNMLAQSGYQPGATAGSRIGQAGLGTARNLQQIETASANRTWRNNQSKIQQERNKIMADMNKERMRIAASEADRQDQPLEWHEGDPGTGAPGVYTMGGRPVPPRYEDPLSRMLRGSGGGGGAPGPAAPPGNDWKSATLNHDWSGGGPAAQAPPPPIPGAQPPMRQGAPGINVPNPMDASRTQQQLQMERARLLSDPAGIQLVPTPAQLPR